MSTQGRTIVRAIRRSDVARLLDLSTPKRCAVCERMVTASEIGGLVVVDGQPVPFCDRVACLEQVRPTVKSP